MAHFFRSKQKQAAPLSEDNPGIYDLNDEEVEQLIGGAPIRHLLVRPSANSEQRAVPGQHLGHLHSTPFQEAFTLQSSPSETHWSGQAAARQSPLVGNGGKEPV